MLDKIKVYKRKDASEVKNFSLTFQEIGTLKLLLVDTYMAEASTLTKTDPLGKFKKEMEGWWFCEEYVVIENGSNIDISFQRGLLKTDQSVLYITIQGIKINLFSDVKYKPYAEFLAQNKYLNIIGGWYNSVIDYSIGEDKYLKLLELIG